MENKNEQVEQVETMKTNKNLWGHAATPGPQGPLTSSKSEGPPWSGGPKVAMSATIAGWGEASRVIGSFIGMDPCGAQGCAATMGIVDFCFGIGLMLVVKSVNNLEELIRR